MSWVAALSKLFDAGSSAGNRAIHQDRAKDDRARELAELHARYLTPWPEPHAWPEAMQPVPKRLHPGGDCDKLYRGKKDGLLHNMRPSGTTAFGGERIPQIYRWGQRASRRARLCRDLTTEAITIRHGSPISSTEGALKRRAHDHSGGFVAVDQDGDGVTDAAVDRGGRVRFSARQMPTARRLLATVATPGGAVVAASVAAVVAVLLLAPRGDA